MCKIILLAFPKEVEKRPSRLSLSLSFLHIDLYWILFQCYKFWFEIWAILFSIASLYWLTETWNMKELIILPPMVAPLQRHLHFHPLDQQLVTGHQVPLWTQNSIEDTCNPEMMKCYQKFDKIIYLDNKTAIEINDQNQRHWNKMLRCMQRIFKQPHNR